MKTILSGAMIALVGGSSMICCAPNLYKYKINAGYRYATRVQIQGKQIWQKGVLTATQAKEYLLEVQVGRVDAKYFPERIPAPALAE